MKPILMDNAIEAWISAIRFCYDIKSGKATLQYQKSFVSSLHNAVELIMKQMMLFNNDKRVAWIRHKKEEERDNIDKMLDLRYSNATNYNIFFGSLSSSEIMRFETAKFGTLINIHREVFGNSLKRKESLQTKLELLQKLRNDETHFTISQGSFLPEAEFCELHNFMIRFYEIMKTWWPTVDLGLESNIALYLDWFCPDRDESLYAFNCEPLQGFTYENAVKNSKLAKEIADIIEDEYTYGFIDSPYTLAKELATDYAGKLAGYDEIWSMVNMMQSVGMIVFVEIQDAECFHGYCCQIIR